MSSASLAGGGAGGGAGGAAGGAAGGGAGGGLVPGTLGDGYANSLFTEALVRSREATVDPTRSTPRGKRDGPSAQVPDIARWDGWVRTFLGVQALLEGLRFEALPADKRKPAQQAGQVVTLYASADKSAPLVKIKRPTPAVFAQQLPLVLDWAELRAERSSEILAQIDNQYAFWGAVVPINNGRMRKTLEVLEVVVQFAVFVEARFKHELNCWRPADLSPQVQPMITTPGHGSFPSGHCTQAYATAHVLARLLGIDKPGGGDERDVQLQRLAARIATNRVVAGVHFPVDNLVGRLLGRCVGEYAMARFLPGVDAWQPRFFDGATAGLGAQSFDPGVQALDTTDAVAAPAFYKDWSRARKTRAASSVLQPLWQAAVAECAHLR